MPHPIVLQLRFTRSEFRRAAKVSEEDSQKRVGPMNCISWTVGHLAWQEQRYFIYFPTGDYLIPEIQDNYGFGSLASTPSAKDMWDAWRKITKEADVWLDTLTSQNLLETVDVKGRRPTTRLYGSLLQRVIYHYWYHTGENMAVRKMLGHKGFGHFVGDIDGKAPYTPE